MDTASRSEVPFTTQVPFTLSLDELPAGRGGVWDWVAAVSRGEPVRLELLKRPSGRQALEHTAVVLRFLARSLDLAAASGRVLASGQDLAFEIAANVDRAQAAGFARGCAKEGCGTLWNVMEVPELEKDGVGICPACGTRYKAAEAAALAEKVSFKLPEHAAALRPPAPPPMPDPAAQLLFVAAEPIKNEQGRLCCLCDGLYAHAHPTLRCVACNAVGLAENMTSERHRCGPREDGCLVGHAHQQQEAAPPPPPPAAPSTDVAGWF